MAIGFALGCLAAVTLFSARANAEPNTNATCVDHLWSFNSRQQSPCLVSAYLGAQCLNNNWGVNALTPGGGPYVLTPALANRCLCNSVVWNLLSACAMCQRESPGTWLQWIGNCPDSLVTVGGYPVPLHPSVLVPHWAYYDFTATGVFNAATAMQQSGPESSAVPSSTRTFASTTNEPTGTTLPPTNKPSSGSSTGAIIGGVVGGILGIALICLIGFVLVRQNQKKNSATQYAQGGFNPPANSQPNLATPITSQYQPSQQRAGMPYSATGSEHKPYTASNPSMYPNTATTTTYYAEPLPYSHPPQPRLGQYRGTPQL